MKCQFTVERFFLKSVRLFIRFMLRKKKLRFLETLEHEYLIELGRGWGAETFREEVGIVCEKASELAINLRIVFDIGANLGKYSVELSKKFPNAEILAFEPNPNAYALLERNLDLHGNCRAINIGFSQTTHSSTLYEPELASPLSSLDNKTIRSREIQVYLSSLNDFCKNEKVIPDFIKMDVEGHEFSILKGANSILTHVSLIQFEFGPTNIHSRIFFKDFWDLLTNLGFTIGVMTKTGLIEISEYKELYESFRTTNYLAFRKSSLENAEVVC